MTNAIDVRVGDWVRADPTGPWVQVVGRGGYALYCVRPDNEHGWMDLIDVTAWRKGDRR